MSPSRMGKNQYHENRAGVGNRRAMRDSWPRICYLPLVMKNTFSSSKTGGCAWVVALALTAFGCGETAPDPSGRVYTGDVPETDVRVGIIASAAHARVFFCGGASSYTTMTRWLNADVDSAHQLSLPSTPNQYWGLQGTVGDVVVSGSVDMLDGVVRPFRATLVGDRTISGLYEGTAGCGRLGLIVDQSTPDTAAVGQGACVGPQTIEQVNPLEPIVRTPDGTIIVNVTNWTGEREVRPAAPPPN